AGRAAGTGRARGWWRRTGRTCRSPWGARVVGDGVLGPGLPRPRQGVLAVEASAVAGVGPVVAGAAVPARADPAGEVDRDVPAARPVALGPVPLPGLPLERAGDVLGGAAGSGLLVAVGGEDERPVRVLLDQD